jgi:hypothetical protein
MEKVTAKEFQKNQKKYLDMLEAGELVEVRGMVLTVYTPEPEKPDRIYALEQLKQTLRDIEQGKSEPLPISSQDQPYIRTDGKVCECCQKGIEALYEVWEDGEERIVCELCLKNRHGKMWKQFATSKIEDDEGEKVVPSLQNVPELRPTSSSPKFSAPLWKQPKKKKVDSRK